MKIIRTALIAASLVVVAASAQAQVLTNIHGGPANPDAANYATQVYSDQARGAFAQHPARVHRVHPQR
jgi:hypothetical protein